MIIEENYSLSELLSLKGRTAVITGAGGALGRVFAETLAELGASLCLVDRDAEALKNVALAVSSVWPVDILEIVIDLVENVDRNFIFTECAKKLSPPHILVNNAAFVGSSNLQGWAVPFLEQSITTWKQAMDVNLTSVFELSQLFCRQLTEEQQGSIINIASIYGLLGPHMSFYEGTSMGNPAAYAASKGGVIQLTRWLATVLGPEVRVNSITPGGIERNQPAAFVEKYVASTPLGRMGREHDLKGGLAFLASDASRWVTGSNLVIDGGFSAW